MREIFRGETTEGEWVAGLPTRKHPLDKEINRIQLLDDYYENDITMFFCVKDVIPETVGQYTGVTDINNRKIFEGDIVKSYNAAGEMDGIGVVHWSDLFAGWHIAKNRSMYSGHIAFYEVIGNVHDNPELLEVNNG